VQAASYHDYTSLIRNFFQLYLLCVNAVPQEQALS